jgi:hypothetical protein
MIAQQSMEVEPEQVVWEVYADAVDVLMNRRAYAPSAMPKGNWIQEHTALEHLRAIATDITDPAARHAIPVVKLKENF